MDSKTQAAQDLLQQAWQAQQAGQLDLAAEIYRKALGIDETAPAWLGLGQCHLERKDALAALAAFRRAHALLPQSGAKYPQSGTISATITNAPAGLPSTTATVTITFNGTNKANVSVTMAGITSTTTVDLGA